MTADIPTRYQVSLDHERDIKHAVLQARLACTAARFDEPDAARVCTAVSELATNVIKYAGSGQVSVRVLDDSGRVGIEVLVSDQGPGISDIEAAFRDSFSTGGSLGLGLPGVRRLMDELEVDSAPGKGTRITTRRWG